MLRTLLLGTFLLAATTPLAAADTQVCFNNYHDGSWNQACASDMHQGDTPACPGSFDSTGFGVAIGNVAQVFGSGYDMHCRDGETSQGIFLVANNYVVAWEDGTYGSGQYGCGIYAGPMGGGPPIYSGPCPFPLPNPGWGHLLP